MVDQDIESNSGIKQLGFSNEILVVLLLAITLLAFFPSIQNGFTNWDDTTLLVNNPIVKDLSADGIRNIFNSHLTFHYKPLVFLSWSIEYHLFGMNPMVYHIDNLILHMLNVLLVFLMFLILTKNKSIAFFVALLFGLHPMHVESVAWIVQRKDVLYSFFYLSSIISFLLYDGKKSKLPLLILSILFFVMSLLSKMMAVSLPFVLLIIDYYRNGNLNIKAHLAKIPYFLILILPVFLLGGLDRIVDQFSNPTEVTGIPFTTLETLLITNYEIIQYIFKILIPYKLSTIYPYPNEVFDGIAASFYIFPALLLGLLGITFYSLKKSRVIFFSIAFFVLAIFPTLQVFLPMRDAIISDRYTYLPSLGLLFLIVHASYWLMKKYGSKFSKLVHIPLILLSAIFMYQTFERCKIWKDSISLWSDVIAKYDNVFIALGSRGQAYLANGNYRLALVDLNKAVKLRPSAAKTYTNRGLVQYHLNRPEKAGQDYDHALEINENDYMAINNKGILAHDRKEYIKALQLFDRAIDIKGNYIDAYYNRGVTYKTLENNESAMIDFDMVIAMDAQYYKAYYGRADIWRERGEYEQALFEYSIAINIYPDYTEAYNDRGYTKFANGDPQGAILDFNIAIKLDPRYAQAYNNRAVAHFQLENINEALRDAQAAFSLGYDIDPKFISHLQNMLK
ncbi:MAG: tetratricopeptide repeat protein [Bacteroidetes bacterium]|nr:tetratricopeptide repeat protein [Bacteroidota bacterium]